MFSPAKQPHDKTPRLAANPRNMASTPANRLTRRLTARLVQQRGQAMVEFAIVLPILMLIIVGTLSFGRYMNYANDATNMAAEAARYASVDNNPAVSTTQTLQAYIAAQATGGLQSVSGDVTQAARVYLYCAITSDPYPCNVGNGVIACVTAIVAPVPLLGTSASVTITESATLRVEALDSGTNSPVTTGWSTANNSTTTVPASCPATT
jgi:Flp pilus assembly protein TadG